MKEEIHDTFMGQITSFIKSPISNFKRLQKLSKFGNNSEQEDIIWALKDIDFEVKHGEVLGIIGANGAGKSTLLKIVSQITEPTSGRVEINGKTASLLEVGTGMHPELTGSENIYLMGTMLGMIKDDIDKKFSSIVLFSGIEKFIDTPVKRFSSGMRVRLGFSIAAHLDPDILIIDEVLAVGDINFQKKCLDKMNEITKSGRTVLFVSHNMAAIKQLCKKAILIDNGLLIANGDANEMVELYRSTLLSETHRQRIGNGLAYVLNAYFMQDEKIVKDVGLFQDVKIVLEIKSKLDIADCIIGIKLIDREKNIVFAINSSILKQKIELYEGNNTVVFLLERIPLKNGNYSLTVSTQPKGTDIIVTDYYDRVENIASISIFAPENNHGIVNIMSTIIR